MPAMSDQAKKISRHELYERVWKATLKKVAEELGTTYAELSRVCDELNVPKPAHGHWQRLQLDLPVEVFPLPEPTPGMALEGLLKPKRKPRKVSASAADHEIKEATELASSVQTDSSGSMAECEPQAASEEFTASDAPANEPEMPATIQYTREQLYKAIWSTPCIKLAATLGISDVALAKTCRRLGVPRPPRGYWARIEAGEKLPKERLPAAKEGQDVTVNFDVVENIARREEWAASNVLTAGKSNKPGIVELPPEGSEMHPLAEKHRRVLEKAKPGELGFVTARGKDLFWCDMSSAIVPRLVMALHAAICELEDRDYNFEPGDSEFEGLQITRDGNRAELRWSEAKVEIEREPTSVDKRKPSWTWQLKETKPAGKLSIEVSALGLRGKRKWTEGDGRSLEELLGVVIEKVEATFRGFEAQREREAAWAKQREEEEKREAERQAKEAEKRAKEEKERKERERVRRHEAKLEEIAEARCDNLAIAAQQWIEAQGVSAFIDYCENRWRRAGGGELSKAQSDWLAWARVEAEKTGPFAKGYPDPAVDGKLDASTVPVGGPYPETKTLEEVVAKEPAPAAPEVKMQYVEPPRQPEQFPFWLLQRKH